GRLTLAAAVREVIQQLVFGVRPFRHFPCRVELVQRERRGRRKALARAGEVQVEPEQRVKGDVPELRELGSLRMRIPRVVSPQYVGTGADGVVEHVDGRPELLPNAFFPEWVHIQMSPVRSLLS